MHTSSLTSKGQVTIPTTFRQALGLSTGDQIDFEQVGETLVIRRHENSIQACFGILKARHGVSLAQMESAIAENPQQSASE